MPGRVAIAAAGTALLRGGDAVLFIVAALGLAVWLLVRTWRDGARDLAGRPSRFGWLAMDIAIATIFLTAGADSLANELREGEDPPAGIAEQAIGNLLWCGVVVTAVWALGAVSAWWRSKEAEDPGE